VVLALPLGVAIGVGLGALGGGGAVLALPLFVYVLGEDVHAATTASLLVVVGAAVTGGAAQASRAQVCWPQVATFAPAALAGALAGTIANQAVGGRVLLLALVPVLLAAAFYAWHRPDTAEGVADACPPLDVPRSLSAGLVVGAFTGFLGVGGGFLVVPLLMLALEVPLRRAIGTSLVIVGIASVAGLGAHLWRGAELPLGPALAMALGCALGAVAGVRWGARLSRRTLGRVFALLLVAVAASVLATSLV
jgi:uncharacterized protein